MPEPFFTSAVSDEHGRALLTVEAGGDGGNRVLVARGEVDLNTADLLTDCGRRLLAQKPKTLVLDLSAVTFFSAAGLRTLMMLSREAGSDTQVSLRAPSQSVRLVLDLSGLADAFDIQ